MSTPVIGNSPSPVSPQIPVLLTKEITDLYLRKNFVNLAAYFAAQNQFTGFNFFEINATAAVTAQTLNHNLNYTPKDIVVTQMTGTGSVQFLYGSFNSTSMTYTATGPCRVRFFVGTYLNDTSTVAAQSTDTETFLAAPIGASTANVVQNVANYQMLGTEFLVLANGGGTVTLPTAPVANQIARIQKADAGSSAVVVDALTYRAPELSFFLTASPQSPWGTQGLETELVYSGTNWIQYRKAS